LPDAKDVVLKTDAKGLFTFSAVAHGEPFSFTSELFGSVLPEVSNCWFMLKKKVIVGCCPGFQYGLSLNK
jgi:hypothetical protein